VDGISVSVDIPGFRMTSMAEEGTTYAALDIPGWTHIQEVGKPAVPVRQ